MNQTENIKKIIMINANELRLGNWVNVSITDHSEQVTLDMFKTFVDSPGAIRFLNPIPLTPEVLQSIGAEYRKCGISGANMWQGLDLWTIKYIRLRGNVSTAKGGVLKLEEYFNSHFEYLHQLQNIIFDLTGEEISYQPKTVKP